MSAYSDLDTPGDGERAAPQVLDLHTHPLVPDTWTPAVRQYVERANPEIAARASDLTDPAAMRDVLRAQGVDQAVVLAEEAPLTTGMVTSEYILDFTAEVEGLHAFVSLNPNLDADLVKRLKELRAHGEVKGLKFLPSYQHFTPNDARLYPLYAYVQELGLPITFHTGISRFPGTRLKYADPLLLDDVAVDFPHLAILLAHAGRGVWYDSAALLATLHENVYLEVSGLPARNLPRYFPNLDRLADKIVFGSDFPGLSSIQENIDAIRDIFSPEDAHRILWENGARLLRLEYT